MILWFYKYLIHRILSEISYVLERQFVVDFKNSSLVISIFQRIITDNQVVLIITVTS